MAQRGQRAGHQAGHHVGQRLEGRLAAELAVEGRVAEELEGERQPVALELLRDPAFDCLLTGESPFETLPDVMPRLVSRTLPALCHAVTYDTVEVPCSA